MEASERVAGLEQRVSALERYVDRMVADRQANVRELRQELDRTELREEQRWESYRREFEASKRFVATTLVGSAGVVVAAVGVLVVLLSGGPG